jgi:hypothetical protein
LVEPIRTAMPVNQILWHSAALEMDQVIARDGGGPSLASQIMGCGIMAPELHGHRLCMALENADDHRARMALENADEHRVCIALENATREPDRLNRSAPQCRSIITLPPHCH